MAFADRQRAGALLVRRTLRHPLAAADRLAAERMCEFAGASADPASSARLQHAGEAVYHRALRLLGGLGDGESVRRQKSFDA